MENVELPKKHRAISQVMGNLVVLGIVSSIGSVILFHGLDEINAFNYDLSFHDSAQNDGLREDIVFEHIYFKPGTDELTINLLNVGSISSTLDKITVVKSDTQEIIVDRVNVSTLVSPDSSRISVKGQKEIVINNVLGSSNWNDSYYVDSDYKISITTSRNNFFSTIAIPFNS